MGGESSSSTSVLVYRPLDRKSSIENEPRTLNIHQLQFAREAALSVLNTTSIEEALRIFTQGLEPVVNCVHDDNNEGMMMMEYEEDEEEEEGSYNLLRIPSALRDIASAPF
ncbi:PREDICTED: uncharacterized protein LOC109146497 isoform X1 [Ipomoea nil]|uniref:uncharacterized protein LOC109146497 isoform X1 n=1 Tax=Ipomoea nil TaxID=35883 RepID=UPI00090123AA|nr:PREDICTED: uncharacterized protein LOC109146497 isoform X1 [Ipomoea nil]